jgi:hypothetical protein
LTEILGSKPPATPGAFPTNEKVTIRASGFMAVNAIDNNRLTGRAGMPLNPAFSKCFSHVLFSFILSHDIYIPLA